jgi:hypothetical protein
MLLINNCIYIFHNLKNFASRGIVFSRLLMGGSPLVAVASE